MAALANWTLAITGNAGVVEQFMPLVDTLRSTDAAIFRQEPLMEVELFRLSPRTKGGSSSRGKRAQSA